MSTVSMTRRRAMQVGAVGAVLLGGGSLLSWFTRGYDDAAAGTAPIALSKKELLVVKAIVEALYPAGDARFPSGVELDVHHRVDEEAYSLSPDVRSDLKAALQLLEHAPISVGVFGRLTSLPVERRAEVLDAYARRGAAVLVQATVSVKQLCSLYYFGDARVWSAIGYDGPWQKDEKPPESHARYLTALLEGR